MLTESDIPIIRAALRAELDDRDALARGIPVDYSTLAVGDWIKDRRTERRIKAPGDGWEVTYLDHCVRVDYDADDGEAAIAVGPADRRTIEEAEEATLAVLRGLRDQLNVMLGEDTWLPCTGTYPTGALDIWTSLGNCFEECSTFDGDGDAELTYGDAVLSSFLAPGEMPTHYRPHVAPKGPKL